MRSASATEVPPNFMTTVPGTRAQSRRPRPLDSNFVALPWDERQLRWVGKLGEPSARRDFGGCPGFVACEARYLGHPRMPAARTAPSPPYPAAVDVRRQDRAVT